MKLGFQSRYVVAVVLMLLLTACPGTETPEPTRDARRLVGTAVTQTRTAYNGPAEDIFMQNETDFTIENVLQVGRISSTGEVDVTLPDTLADDLLVPAVVIFLPEGEGACAPSATVTISDSDTRIKDLGLSFVGLATESGQPIFEFDSETPAFPQTVEEIANFGPKLTSVVKLYADRDVDVRGTCTLVEQEGDITSRIIGTYDLELKRGWNDATFVLEGRELDGGRVFETTNTITTGIEPDETTLFIFSGE
ncbi:MAG: hypothetical protein AAF267_10865 [Deinococcota bacterium]